MATGGPLHGPSLPRVRILHGTPPGGAGGDGRADGTVRLQRNARGGGAVPSEHHAGVAAAGSGDGQVGRCVRPRSLLPEGPGMRWCPAWSGGGGELCRPLPKRRDCPGSSCPTFNPENIFFKKKKKLKQGKREID